MSLRLRLLRLLMPPMLVLISSLLPIPYYFLSTSVQAQTSQDQTAEADRLLQQGNQQFNISQYQAAIQSWQKALAIYQELKNRNGQANSLNNLGLAYNQLGQYAKAIELYQQSLAIFRDLGNRNGQANSLMDLGLAYKQLGQYAKAIELYPQSLAIFRDLGDHNGQADSLMDLGNAYSSLGQYAKAIELYQQSLAIFRDLGDRNGQGNSLNNLGLAYNHLGQYAKAIELYQQSLAIFRDLGNRDGQANSLISLSNPYFYLGQYAKVIEFLQQSLAIFRDLGNRNGQAKSLMGLGNAYFYLGQYVKAIEFLQQSLAIFRDLGDRNGQADSLMDLGNAFKDLGQYAKDIEFYQQSLAIFRDLGDRDGQAKSLIGLGITYSSLGQYAKTIELYQQSLAIFRDVGNRSGESVSLNNLGNTFKDLGQYAQAIELYQQSLAIKRDIDDHNGQANSLNNLGNAYNKLGQYAKAIEFDQQSLAIFRDLGDRNGQAHSLMGLGEAYNNLGQYARAIEFYQQSVTIFRDIGDHEGEGITLTDIGSTLEKQNQSELAILFYKQSVNVREDIRQDLRKLSREQQASYTKNIAADSYRGLASLLLQKNRVMEALQVLDLLKVQELQDYLRNVQGKERTVKGIELFPQEQKILQDYTTIQTPAIRLGAELADLRQLQTRTPTQQQRIQEIEKIQAQTNQKMSEFLKSSAVVALSQQIQQTAPQQNLTLSAYKDLQIRLNRLGKRIALFYTLVLDDRLELVLLPPGKPPIRRSVAIKRTELEKTIQTFRQDLQDPNSEVKETAQKLYNQLIKPIESDLQQADVQSIIYAPDGQMRYIPLAALYDGKQWLTERYQINYLTALALTKLEPESINAPRVLAGAFTQGRYSVQVAGQTYDFQGLRFAKTEVEGLGAAIPNTTKLFDKAFNRDAILSQIKNYSIVHMATHAVFVKGAPEDSFILMGDGNRINLKEIEEWKLPNVALVVLSACQTALGEELGNGLEILGFGYQLQRTGVRASIASLWEVNDGGTQTLMDILYARLKSGKITKVEAIREAQIAMITGKNQSSDSKDRSSVKLTPGNSGQSAPISLNLSHPYYWASFILIGNGL
ncbi:MAG: tetratricopeptide repeat protein [Nostoc sp.]